MSYVLRQVRERLMKDVEQMKLHDPNFKPGLVVLQVSVGWEFYLYVIGNICGCIAMLYVMVLCCRLETAMIQTCTST